MNKIVNVENAGIQSIRIQISQLTMGGNQKMSQKVFRQIQVEDIFDFENGCLRGTPWGYVSYFWPDNYHKRDADCLHIIWQKGEELRRAFLPNYKKSDQFGDFIEMEDPKWNPTVVSFDDKDIYQPNPVLHGSFTIKNVDKLIEEAGLEVPTFPVFVLEKFDENMVDAIKFCKENMRPYIKGWETKVEVDDTTMTFRDYFWLKLREKYNFNDYIEEVRQIGINILRTSYQVYINNKINPYNRLLVDMRKRLKQIFI